MRRCLPRQLLILSGGKFAIIASSSVFDCEMADWWDYHRSCRRRLMPEFAEKVEAGIALMFVISHDNHPESLL